MFSDLVFVCCLYTSCKSLEPEDVSKDDIALFCDSEDLS